MDREVAMGTSREVPAEMDAHKTNIFKELVPEAKSTLRRLMLNTNNEKISREIATEILDRAGEGRKFDASAGTRVLITSSEVNLLIQAAKEVGGEVQ